MDWETVEVPADGWGAWLETHHGRAESVWLVLAKKGGGADAPFYSDAVDEALAWGWIDSRPAKLDAARYKVLMSPRKAGSVWSAINKARIARLEAAGRMRPPGCAKIAAAMADGSWEALDAVEAEQVPAELVRALEADAEAASGFAAYPQRVRKNALQWLAAARTAPTRERRVGAIVAAAVAGETPNAWPPLKPRS